MYELCQKNGLCDPQTKGKILKKCKKMESIEDASTEDKGSKSLGMSFIVIKRGKIK